jgi:hypothetical protein
MGIKPELKYYIANQLECVEHLLIVYEIEYNVIIDRRNCLTTLIPILREMYSVFNAFDYIEKYYTATLKYSIMNSDFRLLFTEQYTREFKMKNERKLF